MMIHVAFNTELPAGQAPEWVELLPKGPLVRGLDGREWRFGDAEGQAVLAAFNSRAMPLPIDWEHATEHRAARGEEAPAAGWIKKLELRGGALWGLVEWTPRASNQVANREYRFLSPVFFYGKSDLRIHCMVSAGLTNTPNLRLAALNRESRQEEEEVMDLKLCKALGLLETATMDEVVQAATALKADLDKALNKQLPKELAQALGLAETATAEQVVAKVADLAKAANKAEPQPDLAKYVPRADYDQVMARATNAEAKLTAHETKAKEQEITAAVDKAVAEGKIAPSSKDFYLAMCRKEDGLEEFNKFAASAPVVIKDPQLPRQPGPDGSGQLTESELAVCRNLGVDPKDFAKNIDKE